MTITMYQISKELLLEKESWDDNIASASIGEKNKNACKQFAEVLNAVGIDERIFKTSNRYTFNIESKDVVKRIIKNQSSYKALMKIHPSHRERELLQNMVKDLTSLLSNEIQEPNALSLLLNTVDVVTGWKKEEFTDNVKNIIDGRLIHSWYPDDDTTLQAYYLGELEKLNRKLNRIAHLFSEYREEEIVEKAVSITHTENDRRLPIDRLIAKELTGYIGKKDSFLQGEMKLLREELGLSEKEIVTELKNLLKSKEQQSEYFILVEDDSYSPLEVRTPHEVLGLILDEYDSMRCGEVETQFSKEKLNTVNEFLNEKRSRQL